jgi:hypothetical protein
MEVPMRLKILMGLAGLAAAAGLLALPAGASALSTRCEEYEANPGNTFLREECERERAEEAHLAAEEQAQREEVLASPEPCQSYLVDGQGFCEPDKWWREITEECRELEAEAADPFFIAVCWHVQAAARAKQRPKEAEEERKARRARREAERERREWAHKPTVTRAIAQEFARRLMRRTEIENWWLDCDRPGRINRITWACKVSIFYECLRGRIRVVGAGIKNGVKYFRAEGGRLRQCRV